ncbi:hypothetical protein KV557_24545 [Kitasatospora aureofaciens]|uniref:hypothetical protein n=1 Tax=Kitasatospora aureofaciens TaxID=1894 RepID=UPI001C461216|nr:hypothetical protein [Kitasatospora aureofaciens]MBV6700234.1 hypothetical protein [Kitasatospora aureofaciens]
MPVAADQPPPRRTSATASAGVTRAHKRALVLWQIGEVRRKTRLRRARSMR